MNAHIDDLTFGTCSGARQFEPVFTARSGVAPETPDLTGGFGRKFRSWRASTAFRLPEIPPALATRDYSLAQVRFEPIGMNEQPSFRWRHLVGRKSWDPLHFHPEFELVHIQHGHGRRLVGDSIGRFAPGDLVFLSPNVPHVWQLSPGCSRAEMFRVRLSPDFLSSGFFKLPEMQPFVKWMADVGGGVTFAAAVREEMRVRFKRFATLDESERLLELLSILCRLSRDRGCRPLGTARAGRT